MEIKSARFVVSAQDPSSFPTDGIPQIAVAGRSNVGKSSLLNFLTGRKKLVKTSQSPGKTRLINFFLMNEGGAHGRPFYLVDIPGFGYARAGRQIKRLMETAIESYFNQSRSLAGLLYLVDTRVTDSEVDEQALEWLTEFDFPLLVIGTKGDKLGKQEIARALGEITKRHDLPQAPLVTSSLKNQGRAEVLEQIEILLENAGQGSGPRG